MAGLAGLFNSLENRALALLASSGNVAASSLLGERKLWGGKGCSPDPEEGLRLLKFAEQKGDVSAMMTLGWAYACGEGVPVDEVQSARYYTKAAKAGHPLGMMAIATSYIDGSGVGRDYEAAVTWSVRAAKLGVPEGMAYAGLASALMGRDTASREYFAAAPRNESRGFSSLLSQVLIERSIPEPEIRTTLRTYLSFLSDGGDREATLCLAHMADAWDGDLPAAYDLLHKIDDGTSPAVPFLISRLIHHGAAPGDESDAELRCREAADFPNEGQWVPRARAEVALYELSAGNVDAARDLVDGMAFQSDREWAGRAAEVMAELLGRGDEPAALFLQDMLEYAAKDGENPYAAVVLAGMTSMAGHEDLSSSWLNHALNRGLSWADVTSFMEVDIEEQVPTAPVSGTARPLTPTT